MTILEYRTRLGWSQRELSRQAKIDYNSVRKAEQGQPIAARTALAIANAFSSALGERVLVEDITGINVSL